MKTTKTQLIINTMKRAKYNELCATGDIQYDQLYLVEDDVLDAFGKRVVNVSSPISSTDAVNKSYLESNYIGVNSITSYIDNTKIYSEKSTLYPLGARYVDGSMKVFEKQADPSWDIVVNKPDTLSPSDITITYSGDEFGWKFSFNGTYEFGTNKTILADTTKVKTDDYDIVATRIWPQVDSYISKKQMYSCLSSISESSQLSDVTKAISEMNSILSGFES